MTLTMALSGVVCHPWGRIEDSLQSTYLPNLKSLSPPITKIMQGDANLENGVVWSTYGSLKVTENKPSTI